MTKDFSILSKFLPNLADKSKMRISDAGILLIFKGTNNFESSARELAKSDFQPEEIVNILTAKNLITAGSKLIKLEKELTKVVLKILD